MVNKYTYTILKPELKNNFQVLIPSVNILINSGKKILFFLYEIAGMLLLKIIGSILFLKFKDK